MVVLPWCHGALALVVVVLLLTLLIVLPGICLALPLFPLVPPLLSTSTTTGPLFGIDVGFIEDAAVVVVVVVALSFAWCVLNRSRFLLCHVDDDRL